MPESGGLEPSENSWFFRNHGFKLRITISEDEDWSELNEGKIAASVTTVDVLAAYGRQLHAVVPAQIGFSRGADGVIVRTDIKRINQLKGQTIAAAQFTEVDFFIRDLAQEAGLPIHTLGSLDATPHPDRLNLIYTEDGFAAGDLFASDLKSGKNRLAGAVTWEPKVSEVVEASGGKAHVLTTNRNLLIIADVLILHRGFAEQNPKVVEGLVQGLLEGNRMVRDRPDQYLDVVGRPFKWSREETRAELSKVHLSNLPENRAFFSGAIDAAGSFGGADAASAAFDEPLDQATVTELRDVLALYSGRQNAPLHELAVHVGQTHVAAAEAERELGVVHPKQVQHGGVQVMDEAGQRDLAGGRRSTYRADRRGQSGDQRGREGPLRRDARPEVVVRRVVQPFTEPMSAPLTKYFCSTG